MTNVFVHTDILSEKKKNSLKLNEISVVIDCKWAGNGPRGTQIHF